MTRASKTSLALRVDANVVEWFKAQGPGYQTRLNAVSRALKKPRFDESNIREFTSPHA
ncbi:MAG: BrnA antitoxin family protein [Candidatus Binatia bacterium]